MQDTLEGLTAQTRNLPSSPPKVVQVDVSRFYGRPPERPLLLEWRKPSIKEIYRVSLDATELLKRYPLWQEQLAVHVATLGICHVAPNPGGLAPGLFYAQIADGDNSDLWNHLINRMGQEFPVLIRTNLPMVQELLDLCVQYLHRHPEELGHLSADVMEELKTMTARQSPIVQAG